MKIAYSLPLFIRNNLEYNFIDINMMATCIKSLEHNEDAVLVVYNQGGLSNDEVENILKGYDINYDILGTGNNDGIAVARQRCFEHVWTNYPNIKYQGELHLDMIFYKGWYEPIIKYLDENEEPLLSPAIIDRNNNYSMDKNFEIININMNVEEKMNFLSNVKVDKIKNGFVHPTIHNSQILKEIGGIDLRFFKGKQGYEDYSILIGYYNYLGSYKKWKPKMYGMSTVYHLLSQQRWTVEKVYEDIDLNFKGLYEQYGTWGLKVLSEMLDDHQIMGPFYEQKVNEFVNYADSVK